VPIGHGWLRDPAPLERHCSNHSGIEAGALPSRRAKTRAPRWPGHSDAALSTLNQMLIRLKSDPARHDCESPADEAILLR